VGSGEWGLKLYYEVEQSQNVRGDGEVSEAVFE
jgi:hypothetical protein